MAEPQLSRAAHDRLTAELENLVTRGRIDIAGTIQRARELGDLKENADYHAAREDQGRMEARIRQLQALTEHAVIVEEGDGDGTVATGSIVSLRYEGDTEVERYLVGSIEERRNDLSVISPKSPLGLALLGHKEGDVVGFDAPSGTLTVEIVKIGA